MVNRNCKRYCVTNHFKFKHCKIAETDPAPTPAPSKSLLPIAVTIWGRMESSDLSDCGKRGVKRRCSGDDNCPNLTLFWTPAAPIPASPSPRPFNPSALVMDWGRDVVMRWVWRLVVWVGKSGVSGDDNVIKMVHNGVKSTSPWALIPLNDAERSLNWISRRVEKKLMVRMKRLELIVWPFGPFWPIFWPFCPIPDPSPI